MEYFMQKVFKPEGIVEMYIGEQANSDEGSVRNILRFWLSVSALIFPGNLGNRYCDCAGLPSPLKLKFTLCREKTTEMHETEPT